MSLSRVAYTRKILIPQSFKFLKKANHLVTGGFYFAFVAYLLGLE